MSAVEVAQLRRSFGTFEALAGVDFTIEPGQIVGLLGPNGAGKSTTMKILTTFLAPTAGRAWVAGHDVLAEPIEVRKKIGYLPESSPIDDAVSVAAYLAFVGRVRGLGAAERARATARVAEECGIADRLDQRIGTLSKGYRQRVGLAQALLHQPPILILDEPTAGLDPNQIVEIRSLIRQVGATRTVILSTHILSEVEATCDRVLILHQGRLVADDRTDAVVASSRGAALTVGVAAGKVQTTGEAIAAALGRIPGVTSVRVAAPIAEQHRLVVHADRDVRAEVFAWAVAGGHVLVELAADRSNLEDVFRRLTEAQGAA